MKTPDRSPGDYPHKVLESTRLYVDALLREITSLKRDVASYESENSQLREQLRQLRTIADSQRTEQQRTEAEKRRIQDESEKLASRFIEIEKQNNDLANLYVASYQLHSTVERDEVLQAIREIVINLIGSEEFGLYECRDGNVELITSAGSLPANTPVDEVRELGLDRSLESGDVLVAEASDRERALVACIPLRLGDRVIGCIAIFELLGHKPWLEQIDHELFDLLAAHAAPALRLAELDSVQQA